jgi:hypothetical protein
MKRVDLVKITERSRKALPGTSSACFAMMKASETSKSTMNRELQCAPLRRLGLRPDRVGSETHACKGFKLVRFLDLR